MSDNFFFIIIAIATVGLFAVMIMYYMLTKKMNKEDLAYIKELKKGTQKTGFSTEVIYQKLYVFYTLSVLPPVLHSLVPEEIFSLCR